MLLPLVESKKLILFRYFQGDLDISSIHGIGTDCFIYLRSMQANVRKCHKNMFILMFMV